MYAYVNGRSRHNTGSTLNIDYSKMGFSFTAYIGLYLAKTNLTSHVIDELKKIPYVVVAHQTTGQYNIFCEIKAAIRIMPKR